MLAKLNARDLENGNEIERSSKLENNSDFSLGYWYVEEIFFDLTSIVSNGLWQKWRSNMLLGNLANQIEVSIKIFLYVQTLLLIC